MKKVLVLLFILLGLCNTVFAESSNLSGDDLVTYSENSNFGLKDKEGNVITPAQYKKLIRVGKYSWIAQNKKYKFGLIDNQGNILIPIKYTHAERIVSKFSKFGTVNNFGVYDEYGNTIVQPEYAKVDILYGNMFLTYKDYKYGIVGYDGKIILPNEYDNIYMPKRDVIRIQYNGKWIELQQSEGEALTLPTDVENTLATDEDFNLYHLVVNTGITSSYSVLTFSDYLIKLISSISPAHEDTIDELMLSQGADTISILKKMSWIPKYPIVYVQKYYQNVRNPNNGPLTNVRNELKQHYK